MTNLSIDELGADGRTAKQATPSREKAAHVERVLVLEAGRADQEYWHDLWRYRELFAILAWRDIAVRYKQSALGVAWAVVRPFLTMIVFVVVFGGLAQLPSEGAAPYPVMVFAGLLPWFLFSTILSDASNSLVTNARLVSKVFFPRMIVPGASAVVSFVDLAINIVLLLFIMLSLGFWPTPRLFLLPVFTLLAGAAAIGPALLLSALNVKYRDFRFIVPFIVQFGLYVSPVGFSSSVVPEEWRILYALNPMVGVIDGFRWCILGEESALYLPGFAISLLTILAFLVLGLRTFRHAERTFADLV